MFPEARRTLPSGKKRTPSVKQAVVVFCLIALPAFELYCATTFLSIPVFRAQHRPNLQSVRNATYCWLNPAWGDPEPAESDNLQVCVGPRPNRPNSTATQLTCRGDTKDDIAKTTQEDHPGFTISLLYYAQPSMLLRHLELLDSYPPELRKQLTLLIVDDGSPAGLQAKDYVENEKYDFRIRLARVTVDITWNIGGARNLAFFLADTSSVLLLDLDVLVPEKTAQLLTRWQVSSEGQHFAHTFNRIFPDNTQKMHPACTFISREAYWINGGCDESFVGNYGYTDPHFWHRFGLNGQHFRVIRHRDVYLFSFDLEACDESYVRNETQRSKCLEIRNGMTKLRRDAAVNKKKAISKARAGCWSNSYLRFPWVMDSDD